MQNVQDNKLQGRLLLMFMLVFLVSVVAATYHYSSLFRDKAFAYPATEADTLFNTTTIFTGIAFLVTQVMLFVFAWRYRAKGKRARFQPGNVKLEIIWIAIPLLVFIFLFVQGQPAWNAMTEQTTEGKLTIDVIAAQFTWHTRYPGTDGKLGRAATHFVTKDNPAGRDLTDPLGEDDFVPLQLHVPKGRPVKFLIRSNDVLHSFYVPFFKTKMDAVPGMITSINVTATHTTDEMRSLLNDPGFNFEVACAELCGRMHFAMKMILVVDTPEDFDRWLLEHQSTPLTDPS